MVVTSQVRPMAGEHVGTFARDRWSATDATTKLMQLCQPEPFSVIDHHHTRLGHIDADLHHRCGHENMDVAASEALQHLRLLAKRRAQSLDAGAAHAAGDELPPGRAGVVAARHQFRLGRP